LLLGITFAVYLMMFVTSMFFGVLNHASANIINVGSTIWVTTTMRGRQPKNCVPMKEKERPCRHSVKASAARCRHNDNSDDLADNVIFW